MDTITGDVMDRVKHEAHVELMNNTIYPKSKKSIYGKEPSQQELRRITYDSTFWNNYTVLQATPLEEQIIKDLSAKMELDKQFAAFNKLEEGTESITETPEFKEIMMTYQGTPTYVVLWAGWSIPNFYELVSSKALRKLIKKKKIDFVLISLDEDDIEWEMQRDLNGLNISGIEHHRLNFPFTTDITRKFFGNVLPSYILFDQNGDIYDLKPPLPNVQDIKSYYEGLLKRYQSSKKR
jgi:hypothetical protein